MRRVGKQSIVFANKPCLLETASVVGPKEGEGPLAEYFDVILPDNILNQDSWEKAEQAMLLKAIDLSLQKSSLKRENIDFFIAGDLLNQIISAGFTARELSIPFFGIYGACSTSAEGLALGSILLDGGFAEKILVATSSHNCTAERQYRGPTEQGMQLVPTSQCTVTGAGAFILSTKGSKIKISSATIGRVIDLGIKDPNDMGSAMAPAAADTLYNHFHDFNLKPEEYDLILTGDLARVGSSILKELLAKKGIDLGANYFDAGMMIFSPEQGVNAGGSGCGCIASTIAGFIFSGMKAGKWKKVLLVATGAMLSLTSYQQKESIPSIAHAVVLEYEG